MSKSGIFLCCLFLLILAGCGKGKQEQAQSAPQQPTAQQPAAQPPAAQSPSTQQPEAGSTPAERPSGVAKAPRKTKPGTAQTKHPQSQAATETSAGVRAAAPSSAQAGAVETAAPPAPPRPQFAVIPSGTKLMVRLQDALDSGVPW